jgi:tight adherence protein C
MTAAVLVFGGLGAAVAGLLAVLVPQRPGLLAAIGRLDAARSGRVPGSAPVLTERHDLRRRAEIWLSRYPALRRTSDRSAVDLAITSGTAETFALRRVLAGLTGFCAVPALAIAVAIAGLRIPAVALLLGVPLATAGGYWLPKVALAKEAEWRRREFRRALSCYLDLVAMSLAGGRGAPQALPEAAALSDGWAFRLLADALDVARLAGRSPWQGLGELGDRIGVPELCELAGSLALVGDHGARVRDTLTARAATLRRRALTDAEGQAAQADQGMRIAQVLLAFGFLLLIAYPALAAVLLL